MTLSPSTATANQRKNWLAASTPAAATSWRAPRMAVTQPQGVGLAKTEWAWGDEHVGAGDRGDALDHVEAAGDEQQDGREQDQSVAVATGVAPGLAGGWRR